MFTHFLLLTIISSLQDMEGKEIGRGSGYKLKDLGSLEEGSTLPVGGKEVEVSPKT